MIDYDQKTNPHVHYVHEGLLLLVTPVALPSLANKEHQDNLKFF